MCFAATSALTPQLADTFLDVLKRYRSAATCLIAGDGAIVTVQILVVVHAQVALFDAPVQVIFQLLPAIGRGEVHPRGTLDETAREHDMP